MSCEAEEECGALLPQPAKHTEDFRKQLADTLAIREICAGQAPGGSQGHCLSLPLTSQLQFSEVAEHELHLKTQHQFHNQQTTHQSLQILPKVFLLPTWCLPLQVSEAQQMRSSWPQCRHAACPSSALLQSGAVERRENTQRGAPAALTSKSPAHRFTTTL